ncbi:unnamed protein product [Diabrotica balteata]|uniref:N-acetyltransferase domain-containing protein n=1 Tax=Diabrotica balteata TaxID=107213 RepID=A0A9N9XDD0_DIABA|nr:unnamed protein product [Diabrotica balteata]
MDDADLIIMADFYRDHRQLCYASSCLHNGSRLKKAINTFPIRFISPVGAWEVNGTFFMIVETISNGLGKTQRINFESTKYIVFKDIHHSFHYLITNFIQSKGLEVETEETFHILRMEKDLALDFNLNVPEEVQLRSLQPDDAYEIRAYWPYFYPQTDDYFRILIQANGGYGLFSKKDGELLSWAIKTMSGTIGYVQTVDRAQKRGYATIIVRLMAKEMVFEHQYPVIMVPTSDYDSLNFFEGIGFQMVGLCHNIYLKQKKPTEVRSIISKLIK